VVPNLFGNWLSPVAAMARQTVGPDIMMAGMVAWSTYRETDIDSSNPHFTPIEAKLRDLEAQMDNVTVSIWKGLPSNLLTIVRVLLLGMCPGIHMRTFTMLYHCCKGGGAKITSV
jgi:hypothetical protein